ncbi:MAG: WbqC family protein [Terriglobales bacterium]
MKIAINQPTYLPWMGYFDLIDQVDLFVILDNVQFVKQSWQQRNRIRTGNGLQWLTVPVAFRGRLGQLIKDVEIRDREFARGHIRAIELAYRRSLFFAQYFPSLRERLQELREGLLLDLNLGLISWALEILKIKTPLIRASSLGATGKRTELLANICEVVGATEYFSPLGSAEYLLAEQALLRQRGIDISFQNYQHPQYRQVFKPFEPFASVIDLIFNCGEQALAVIRGGRSQPYSVEQLSSVRGTEVCAP